MAMADNDGVHLLDMPSTVLQEVISWSPDGATANALLKTCRAGNQQRQDPATAALALMRCPCLDYHAALASCAATSHGGTSAVVQHLLRLVGASPDSGGPMPAPTPLLHAALCASAAAGDELAIRALMALPQPPDVNADDSLALFKTLAPVVHLGALQALLECGASHEARSKDRGSPYTAATGSPQQVDVWLLLVQHCSAEEKEIVMTTAAIQALREPGTHALGRLLREGPIAHMWWDAPLWCAASDGALAALTLLLDHSATFEPDLLPCLFRAAFHRRLECTALLLHHCRPPTGEGPRLLCEVLKQELGRALEVAAYLPPRGDLEGMLALLLRHGAAVTAEVWEAAERAGQTALLAMVVDKVAAAAAAATAADA